MTPLEMTLLGLVIVLLLVLIGIGVVLIVAIRRLIWTVAKFAVVAEVADQLIERVSGLLGRGRKR